jgi:predicted TIM-barrel fold metal-dependent hydrolase
VVGETVLTPTPASVIDAHTHAFPAELIDAREALAAREPWFGLLYRNPRAALATASDLLTSMDTAGVGQSVVCGFPWRDLGLCRVHNDALASACAASDGRLSWLATVPPAAGSAAAAEAERAFGLGAAGVGELNADAQDFDLADPSVVAELAAVCRAHRRPLMLHASEPVGHAYPGKGTATPDRLLALIAAYPDLTVVLAHWGGGLPFYELMPEVAATCANVVYDSGASTYLYRPAVFRTVLDLVGPRRVLFGSDYPVLRQDRFLRRLRAVGLTAAETAAVLGENARRVYGLAPRPADAAAPVPRSAPEPGA